MRLTGEELALASQGEWVKDTLAEAVEGIGTDTRDFSEGHAFLALRGPNFDGHSHAHQVADRAVALIGDKQGVETWQALGTPQLEVKDTLQSLGDIANFYRSRLTHTKVVAITGSYGKTTVRSMLEYVLRGLGLEVAATPKNLNNLIGVPKTLLSIQMNADVALIECGISEQGEMLRLSEIVQPDVAIVTGLSQAHAEGLGGLEGVAREKSQLLTHLMQDGWSVLGAGVAGHFDAVGFSSAQPSLSMDDDEAVRWQLDGRCLTLEYDGEHVSFDLALPAKHWAEDMALTTTVAFGVLKDLAKTCSLQAIADVLQSWQPVEGRMSIVQLPTFTLIDDAYNANPTSMQAALDTLAALDGYRVAIIGDMLELGDDAQALHNALELHDIDEVLTVGSLMAGLQAKHPHRVIRVFKDAKALDAWLVSKAFPPKSSTVLVKGSHGTGLYQISDVLKQRGQHVI